MRRVVLYGIGWLAAATAAALLAWQGVGRVGTNVTDRHAAPLTAEQARQQLDRTTATASGGEAGEPPAGGPATTAPGAGGGGGGRPGSTGVTATTRPGATTTTATVTGPQTSTPSGTATTGPGSTASTAPPSGTTETRTYNLVGGSATLRFSPSGVTVVLADPNPGFSVDVDHSSGGRVRVRFDSDSHRSQVEAWWDGGPRDAVREEGDDDSGGSGPG